MAHVCLREILIELIGIVEVVGLEFFAEGFIEGEEQTKIQIATKLLTCGNDIKSVADITELPEETVAKLAEKI